MANTGWQIHPAKIQGRNKEIKNNAFTTFQYLTNVGNKSDGMNNVDHEMLIVIESGTESSCAPIHGGYDGVYNPAAARRQIVYSNKHG
jgi:hypothetical protein